MKKKRKKMGRWWWVPREIMYRQTKAIKSHSSHQFKWKRKERSKYNSRRRVKGLKAGRKLKMKTMTPVKMVSLRIQMWASICQNWWQVYMTHQSQPSSLIAQELAAGKCLTKEKKKPFQEVSSTSPRERAPESDFLHPMINLIITESNCVILWLEIFDLKWPIPFIYTKDLLYKFK